MDPVTNSLTKLDFHVNVDVDVDFLFYVGHHNVVSMLFEGS